MVNINNSTGPTKNDFTYLGGGRICKKVTLLHKPIFSKNSDKGGGVKNLKKMGDIIYGRPLMICYFLVIKAEKNEQKHRAGIENFYKGDLRKSQTVEKNTLPTKEDIEAEKQAN